MQPILAFFAQFGAAILFVILQLFCGFLYFSFNGTSEKMAFLSSANSISASFFEIASNIGGYWNLGAVNDSLAKENARLKMQFPNAKYQSAVDTQQVADSSLMQQYTFTVAKVVNNSLNKANNYITINRGSKHGIQANAGIISASSNGVVGIIKKVSSNYSVAMSIFHEETRISAKIRRNDYFGVLRWNGGEMTHLDLEALPKHAPISKGDSIVTSGYSNLFPEDIFIGIVDTFYVAKGSNFFTAKVKLVADITNVQQVYVVTDLMREEKKKLEQEAEYEQY